MIHTTVLRLLIRDVLQSGYTDLYKFHERTRINPFSISEALLWLSNETSIEINGNFIRLEGNPLELTLIDRILTINAHHNWKTAPFKYKRRSRSKRIDVSKALRELSSETTLLDRTPKSVALRDRLGLLEP